ncbi:hypothetical protein [uncultured Thiodictyon sp.]|uniref:hypothetical protein n=1 Tax=uncultured Thiodictyon sp. TaxID=1846217 RepID=UPI0025FBB1CE|nr:hypothetical protein [uncultured Thiodictyon sp.]
MHSIGCITKSDSLLVCLFTDGLGLARALDSGPGGDADQRRALRELRTWPRLCLVDFAAPQLDLPTLAERLKVTPVAPDALPAWLAERPQRPPPDPAPPPTLLALRPAPAADHRPPGAGPLPGPGRTPGATPRLGPARDRRGPARHGRPALHRRRAPGPAQRPGPLGLGGRLAAPRRPPIRRLPLPGHRPQVLA